MLEAGLVSLLKADRGVHALCATRIYPLLLPDSPVLPAVTYQTISSVSQYTCDGPTGFRTNRIQVDVWALDYLSTKNLSEAIRGVIENFSGLLPDGTFVSNTMRDNVMDLYEGSGYLYRVQTDWIIEFDQQ